MANLLELYKFFNENAFKANYYIRSEDDFNRWQYFIERVLELMLEDYAEYNLENYPEASDNLVYCAEAFFESIFDCISIRYENKPTISEKGKSFSHYLITEPYMFSEVDIVESVADNIAASGFAYIFLINANIAKAFSEIHQITKRSYHRAVDIFLKHLDKRTEEEANKEENE